MSRRDAALVAGLAALMMVALWPLPLVLFDGRLLGHPVSDLADHYQGAWWFGGELLAGRVPTTTGLTHFPEQLNLWYVDPVGAVISLALRGLGSPAAWNLTLFVQVFAAALAGAAMGRDLVGTRAAALICGVTVGASPYMLGLVHSGLTEYLGTAPLVLATWGTLRAMGLDPRGRPAPRFAAPLAGVAVGIAGLQAGYYVVFAGLFVLCTVPGRGWKGRLWPLLVIGGVGAVIGLPAPVASWLAASAADGAVGAHNAPGWSQGPPPATDLLTFVRPGAYYHPDTPAMGNPGILHVNYLGAVAIVLACCAPWRRAVGGLSARPLVWTTAIFGVLLLGPTLNIGHQDLPVPLPLRVFYAPGSPLRMVHHPYRLAAMAMPLLGVLAALGAARMPRRIAAGAAFLILAETLWMSPAPWPIATANAVPPTVYDALPPGPVLDWPPDHTTWNRQYQIWQVSHGHAAPYGVNMFLPTSIQGSPTGRALLSALDDPRGRARNRDVPAMGPPASQAPRGPDLGALGFRAIVLHEQALSPAEFKRARDLLIGDLGSPSSADGAEHLWVLPPL